MQVSFLGQPFIAHGAWMATWLEEQLSNPGITELLIASAWAKRSGLLRLQKPLTAYRARRGTSSVILGIDEGGATKQGLELAMELFDAVYVFHDPSSRTFHPKVYLAQGSDAAEILVGSNNVTAGGLFSNYEAALVCKLTLGGEDDRAFLERMVSWFKTLQDDQNTCKLLTGELLEQLLHDQKYKIRDEDQARTERRGVAEDYDGVVTDTPTDSLFRAPATPMARMAPYVRRVKKEKEPTVRLAIAHRRIGRTVPPARKEQSSIPTPIGPAAPSLPRLRWQKKMAATDAQQPPQPGTNPTGNLRLAKAENEIDHKTFFREEMFGNLDWTAESTKEGVKEATHVTFDVVIDGANLGHYTLLVDHAAYRIAGQNNVPTVLHWDQLLPRLREANYTGAWVVIERRPNGTYRLEITRDTPS